MDVYKYMRWHYHSTNHWFELLHIHNRACVVVKWSGEFCHFHDMGPLSAPQCFQTPSTPSHAHAQESHVH